MKADEEVEDRKKGRNKKITEIIIIHKIRGACLRKYEW